MTTATATTKANRSMLTNDEAAAYLGIQSQTLALWRSTKRHTIPYVRVGRSIRYRQSDLDRWLATRTVGTIDD